MTQDDRIAAEVRAVCDHDGTIRAAILAGRPIDPDLAAQVVMLDFDGCSELVDLGFVSALPKLRRLNLTGTGVRDLSPLAAVETLEALNLSRTEVADLGPVARLPRLAELVVVRTAITDLSPLAGSPTLWRIDIGSVPISDLALLGAMPSLAVLDIGDAAALRGLDLSGFPALETLVGVTLFDAGLWPAEFPATLRELIVGGSAWPEGRPLPDLPRLITPDWRSIDDGAPCSAAFAFWRMVCLAEDEAAGSDLAANEPVATGHVGD